MTPSIELIHGFQLSTPHSPLSVDIALLHHQLHQHLLHHQHPHLLKFSILLSLLCDLQLLPAILKSIVTQFALLFNFQTVDFGPLTPASITCILSSSSLSPEHHHIVLVSITLKSRSVNMRIFETS